MPRWLVIGGGAAGCVVAARLSEREDDEVVLLEAGPDHGPEPHPDDVGPYLTDAERLDSPMVIRRPGARPQPYRQGRGLGGSSLVNGGIVVAGADLTGHDLPLEVPWSIGPLGAAVLAATSDAAPVRLVRRDHRRVTAADAYLRPVADRPNLTIRTATTVVRLLVDGRRVVGALTEEGQEVAADRVVVCAGAIRTPTLLLRSGIDAPAVGRGLQDHAGIAISVELAGRDARDDPAISVTVERSGRQIVVVDRVESDPGLAVLLAGCTDVTSTGSVTLPEPDGPPVVELAQLTTDHDLDGLVLAAREALALLEHPAVAPVVAAAHVDDRGTPVGDVGDDRALRAWLPHHLTGYHHLAGSCRLGEVTDHEGAVRGHQGLYVCDASLLRGVPRRNPYLTVVLLAERLARRWRDSIAQ